MRIGGAVLAVCLSAACAAPTKPPAALAPKHIQSVVRRNHDQFRKCYEAGLARNAKLEGRVQVRFVIERDGRVGRASDAGSDIPDAEVVQCVITRYQELVFDRPQRGIVTVVYPIMFSPGKPVRPQSAPSAPPHEPPLGPEHIGRVMHTRYGAFWDCYDRGLARKPDLAGKVEVRLEISDNGRVTQVTSDAGTTLNDPEVVGCVLSHARDLSFARPVPAGPVSVVHSIDFSSPTTRVQGNLPPEHIQRIIRGSYGKFRKCYEAGVARNSKLEGRMKVFFVIEPDGSVSRARDYGADIPDAAVVRCVIDGFYNLVFDPPQGGVVTVVYPLTFSPG